MITSDIPSGFFFLVPLQFHAWAPGFLAPASIGEASVLYLGGLVH